MPLYPVNHPAFEDWEALWKTSGCRGEARPEFERLARAYAEPARHYHTFQHIGECLEAFRPARALAGEPCAVEFAIWFHDVVYDPRAPDNEEQSAALAVQRLTESGATAELAENIRRLVLATKRHVAGGEGDAALLIDVDLAILGQSRERFEEYEVQIRAEYAWAPLALYAAKRREILQGFLARPRIFNTDFFCERLEAMARENLRRSIENLGSCQAIERLGRAGASCPEPP